MSGDIIKIYLCASLSAFIFETGALTSTAKIVAIIFLGLVACLFGFLLFCVWPVAKTQSMKDREER
jgi:hypothetical protein